MVRLRPVVATVAVAVLITSFVRAEEWSRFRGPNGSGVVSTRDLPVEFGSGNNQMWRTEVPFARSSPVLSQDAIFLTAVDNGKLSTLAIDLATGMVRWQRHITRSRETEMHSATDSATPSPVTDGKSVFVFFQETGLVAYSVDGEERWRLPLGPFRNFYGMAASPILAGNTLILLCDQVRGSFLIAVDKATGKPLWRRQRPGRIESYTTPVLYPDGQEPRQVFVAGTQWVDAYDLASGRVDWSLPGVGTGPVSSPVLHDDLLFVNAPDQAPEPAPPFSEVLAEHDRDGDGQLSRTEVADTWMNNHFGFLDPDGSGQISDSDWKEVMGVMENDNWGLFAIRIPAAGGEPRIVWQSQQSVAYIPTTILYDGILYMVKDGIVTSFDQDTGELLKRGRLTKGSPKVYASPVAADGKIFIGTLEGEMAVLSAGKPWRVLALNDLDGEIHATPAVVESSLIVRTASALYRFASGSKAASVSSHR